MLMLTIILVILLIGLALTILELFFIPGTTIVGILGVMFSIAGIVISYRAFGAGIGTTVLVSTTVVKAGVLYYSLHWKAWSRFALRSAIKSRVNEGITEGLIVGTTGRTVSTLRPIGKAMFSDRTFEVRSQGQYIENGTLIRIVGISLNDIIVEPTNQ